MSDSSGLAALGDTLSLTRFAGPVSGGRRCSTRSYGRRTRHNAIELSRTAALLPHPAAEVIPPVLTANGFRTSPEPAPLNIAVRADGQHQRPETDRVTEWLLPGGTKVSGSDPAPVTVWTGSAGPCASPRRDAPLTRTRGSQRTSHRHESTTEPRNRGASAFATERSRTGTWIAGFLIVALAVDRLASEPAG